MKNKLPSQLLPLNEYAQNHPIEEFLDFRFALDDQSLTDHFFNEKFKSNEFIVWGELMHDNLILSWVHNDLILDTAPICIIDSEANITVIANNPNEFIEVVPYGIQTLIGMSYDYLQNKDEMLLQLREHYKGNFLAKELDYRLSLEGYVEFKKWFDEQRYMAAPLPFSIVETAIEKFPGFPQRARELGLLF